jgi:hypothetical protein
MDLYETTATNPVRVVPRGEKPQPMCAGEAVGGAGGPEAGRSERDDEQPRS